jgi:hypothetical protein
MLKYTPIGSSDADVMDFASTRLKYGVDGPAYDRPDSISVLLGRYGFGLIGSNDTYVQWRFDAGHKLIRIEVIKSRDVL